MSGAVQIRIYRSDNISRRKIIVLGECGRLTPPETNKYLTGCGLLWIEC